MDWGTFFEPIHSKILEFYYNCNVIETSLCKGKGILLGTH